MPGHWLPHCHWSRSTSSHLRLAPCAEPKSTEPQHSIMSYVMPTKVQTLSSHPTSAYKIELSFVLQLRHELASADGKTEYACSMSSTKLGVKYSSSAKSGQI
ncbi:BgTH12-00122 [Blumeria graminis f. sp. triticale]|uniref:Bgt-20987 n=3 Tax=Blumeria graminis TaxID=34373 RepID=A0A381L9K8_BLUGR|nr:BgTH12-00122 [Blumeria graminis f. sp. triticale]VDB92644.1 Bgt-20987 [Blumeria graminis f. sp. tritici]